MNVIPVETNVVTMKTNLFLFFLLISVFGYENLHAQQVRSENGYIVVDNSSLYGMALKSRAEVAASTTTNGIMKRHFMRWLSGTSASDINDKVSPKFAVSPTDVKADGTPGVDRITSWMVASGWDPAPGNADDNMNAEALPAAVPTGCAAYAGPNGGESGQWRLPTLREMLLISMLKTRIEALPGFTPFTEYNYYNGQNYNQPYYWTATEESDDPTVALYVLPKLVQLDYKYKKVAINNNLTYRNIRCVKDL